MVGFVPTGWVHQSGANSFKVEEKAQCEIHLVPYSEHSSYNELREYIKFLKPQKVSFTSPNEKELSL